MAISISLSSMRSPGEEAVDLPDHARHCGPLSGGGPAEAYSQPRGFAAAFVFFGGELQGVHCGVGSPAFLFEGDFEGEYFVFPFADQRVHFDFVFAEEVEFVQFGLPGAKGVDWHEHVFSVSGWSYFRGGARVRLQCQ